MIALAREMIRTRGRETVRVTKVKGHAEDLDVQQGRVRLSDKKGIAEADIAADLGRRHQSKGLIDAGRRLLGTRSYWYPVMTDLHRFMVAMARVSVNHDGKGGTAPDPLVWDQGSRPKVRKLAIRVNVDLASLPGPPGFLNSSWVQINAGHITGYDIAAWPYGVGISVKFTSFLGTLGSMEVVLLVLILLPGLTVLAFSAKLLLFLGPYIGQWVVRIWVILGSPFWSSLSFFSNGLVTDCLVKRLLGPMSGPIVPF